MLIFGNGVICFNHFNLHVMKYFKMVAVFDPFNFFMDAVFDPFNFFIFLKFY